MTFQEAVNALFAAGFSVLGWFAREMWSAVKELKVDLAKLREELPSKYSTKSDMEHLFGRVEAKLDRIADKLDRKADK